MSIKKQDDKLRKTVVILEDVIREHNKRLHDLESKIFRLEERVRE